MSDRAPYEPCKCRRLFLRPDEEQMGPMVDDASIHGRTTCFAICTECGKRCDTDGYCDDCAKRAEEKYRAEHGGQSPVDVLRPYRERQITFHGSGSDLATDVAAVLTTPKLLEEFLEEFRRKAGTSMNLIFILPVEGRSCAGGCLNPATKVVVSFYCPEHEHLSRPTPRVYLGKPKG